MHWRERVFCGYVTGEVFKVAIKTKYHFVQFEYDYASVPLSAPLQLQKTGHFLPKECQKY